MGGDYDDTLNNARNTTNSWLFLATLFSFLTVAGSGSDALGNFVFAPSPAVIERAPLNWSIVKKKTGETCWQHVQKHGVNNTNKPLHGVFDQDPVLTVQEAWYRTQRLGISMDETETLVVPMGRRVGYQGGKLGTGADLPNVTIHTVDGQIIITSYPSN